MENKSPRTPEELIKKIKWYKQWLFNELNCYIEYDTWVPNKEALVKSRNMYLSQYLKINLSLKKKSINYLKNNC